MVDSAYLDRGLCAMARAHRANGMAGHLGAALVAGHCFARAHRDLDRRVYSAIEGELDRIISGEEQWFDPEEVDMTVPEMFEPLPDEPPHPERIRTIADALSGNIDELHQSGHNVIFAAIAIRALGEHPQRATPATIDGIRKLVEGFNGTPAGRQYFGKERGWLDGEEVSVAADDDLPPYCGEQAMAEVAIDELIRTASEHRQGCGGLWHIINHAAALTELSRLGYGDLAHRGFAAHRHHIRLRRALPDLKHELGPMKRARHDPRTPEFWNVWVQPPISRRHVLRGACRLALRNGVQSPDGPQRIACAGDCDPFRTSSPGLTRKRCFPEWVTVPRPYQPANVAPIPDPCQEL